MRTLDTLGINKEEMHHPVKHILIRRYKKEKKDMIDVKLVDFERAHINESPKNVTQFCQFLVSQKFNELLRNKKIIIEQDEMIKLSQDYKNEMSENNFEKIMNYLVFCAKSSQ